MFLLKIFKPFNVTLSRALSKPGLITAYRGCNHHKVLVQRGKLQLRTKHYQTLLTTIGT